MYKIAAIINDTGARWSSFSSMGGVAVFVLLAVSIMSLVGFIETADGVDAVDDSNTIFVVVVVTAFADKDEGEVIKAEVDTEISIEDWLSVGKGFVAVRVSITTC